MNPFWLRASALAAGLCLSAVAQAAAVVGAYTATLLPPAPGGIASPMPNGNSLNNAGQVVGIGPGDRHTDALLWVNGQATSINNPGYRQNYAASSINNAGQVVGSYYYSGDPLSPPPDVSWKTQAVTGLTVVPSDSVPGKTIVRISDQGLFLTSGGEVLAPDGSVLRVLQGLGGGTVSVSKINAQGLVVGASQAPGSASARAVSWANVAPSDLGTLGGSGSFAFGVDNAGRVVGEADVPGDTGKRAVLWQAGGAVDLGTLGGVNGQALAINQEGVVVGRAQNAAGEWRAAVWYGTKAVDLNTLVAPTGAGVLVSATAVNDKGQILANTLIDGSFLLTPGGTPPQPPKPVCSVAYKLNSSNALFFTAQVSLSNLGDAALSGWSVGWTYSAKPYIVSSKGAKLRASANAVSASPLAANTVVAAKSSTVFSFTSLKGKTVPAVSGLKATLGGKDCVVSAP